MAISRFSFHWLVSQSRVPIFLFWTFRPGDNPQIRSLFTLGCFEYNLLPIRTIAVVVVVFMNLFAQRRAFWGQPFIYIIFVFGATDVCGVQMHCMVVRTFQRVLKLKEPVSRGEANDDPSIILSIN